MYGLMIYMTYTVSQYRRIGANKQFSLQPTDEFKTLIKLD